MSLKKKTISSLFWSFLEKFASRGIGFITTVILARLLTPADFGLIAMLTIFISVSESLSNGGLNHALIQKKDADEEDYSVVFYINLIASIVLYLLLFITAPYIANFYDQPILISMTRVLALTFVINSFCYVQQTKLTKGLQFKTLMYVHIPAIIISAIIAIVMAYKGYGVWSLIGQQLSMRFVLATQLWFQSKWKPLLVFNTQKAKSLFSFGGRIMLSTIIDRIYNNIYLILIGKFYSANTLGYYQNSNKLVSTPTDTLATVIRNVTYSTFSSIQDDNNKLKYGLRKSNQHLLFFIGPILVLSAILAEPLFRFVLTEKWLPSVPYFQLLCVVGLLTSLSAFSLDMIKVKGRSDVFLKLNVIVKIFTTIGLIILINYGIWWVISLQITISIVQYLINGYYSGKFINYPLAKQLFDLVPIAILTLIMGGVIWCLNAYFLIDINDVSRILIGFVSGLGLYFSFAHFIKLESLTDIKNIIKKSV